MTVNIERMIAAKSGEIAAAQQEIRAKAREFFTDLADYDVTAAVNSGRIAESERATWRSIYVEAPSATRSLLASMAPGVHPTAAQREVQAAEEREGAELWAAMGWS